MVIVLNGLAIVDFTEENLSDTPSSDDAAPVNRSASNSSNHEQMQLFNSPASHGKTVIYVTFSGRYSFKSQPNTQTAHIPIGPDLMGRYFIELSSLALIQSAHSKSLYSPHFVSSYY